MSNYGILTTIGKKELFMTKSKKFLNIFLAVAFALLTCGMALAVMLPSLSNLKVERDVQALADGIGMLEDLNTATYDGEVFYQIENVDQLTALSWAISANENVIEAQTWASRNFELMADINLQTNSALWTPIGSNAVPFKGKFNGNGHTIVGLVAGFGSAADSNLGFFGKVEGTADDPAMIYDLVIDNFAFADYIAGGDTSGRLVGSIANATLIDVYDMSYVLASSVDESRRLLHTIGTVGNNVTYYAGDTFMHNKSSAKTLYKPGTNGYVPKTTSFDWGSAVSAPAKAGYSLYVFAPADATIYKNGASETASIAPFRIAVDTSGNAFSVASSNYYNELPQENEANAAANQPVIKPIEGKKVTDWLVGGTNTNATTIKQMHASVTNSTYHYVEAVIHDFTYKITIRENKQTLGEIIEVPANSTWASIVAKVKPLKTGYHLTKLSKDSTNYYINDVKYDDENWNIVNDESYPNGSRINDWENQNITLDSEWVGQVSNARIKFANTNDAGARLNAVSNLAIDYTGTAPSASPDLALTAESEEGLYTFKAVADQPLTLTFTLPHGYTVKSVTTNQGTVSKSNSGDNYTVNINGLLLSDGMVTIELEREVIKLNVAATNFTIALSGNTSYTTISSNVISTRVEEQFNIVATPVSGYEYDGYQVSSGFTTVGAPTASGDVRTFPVTVNTFTSSTSSQTLTITAKAKAFTVILTVNGATEYAPGVELPNITINDGTKSVTTSVSGQWDDLTPGKMVTILAPGNAYFNAGTISMLASAGGTLSGGSNGEGQINPPTGQTTIPGGAVFEITVTYTPKNYAGTYAGTYATINGQTASNFVAIKGLNGEAVTDTDVITITAEKTYKFGDTLTLSYNIVSQYYEFVGWYYSTGAYISNQNNATITAPASNVNIYAVVRGKTATFTVSTGNLIENYDGVTGATHTSNLALSTPNVTQLSFTYSSPNSGAVSFTVQPGYTGGRYILSSADNAADAYQAWKDKTGTAYLITTSGNSISGYQNITFEEGQNAASVFFDNADWTLYPILTQRTINVQAAAGEGGSVVSGHADATTAKTYYYGGEGFDITYAIDAFEKTGHTPTGWTFNVGGTQNVTDASILSNGKYLIDFEQYGVTSYFGQTITVTRTYTANPYKLYFDADGGTISAEGSGIEETEGRWYKNVTYGQAIGKLPTATKTGYIFGGWGINATDAYNTPSDKTVTAIWSANTFKVQLDANGGTISGSNKQVLSVPYASAITMGTPTRDGYTFAGWHYMVPNISGSSTTYTYKKAVSSGTVLDSTNFDAANFADTTNVIVYIYASWTFDARKYSASVANVNETYDAGNVVFNVSVTVRGTKYTLGSNAANLPTASGISIARFSWQHNGSPFSGTAHTYGPEIQNVSQSGTYSVTFTLSDTASIQGVTQIATPTIDISASANVEIEKREVVINSPYSDNMHLWMRQFITKNQAVYDYFGDEDGVIDAIKNANSQEDLEDYAAELGEYYPYMYLKLFLPYFVANQDQAIKLAEQKTGTTSWDTMLSFFKELDVDYFNTNFKTLENFKTWIQTEQNAVEITSCFLERPMFEALADGKFYDGTTTISTYSHYEVESASSKVLELGSDNNYINEGSNGSTYVINGDVGFHDAIFEVVPKAGFDKNNFSNIIEKENKYYVIKDLRDVLILPSLTTLTMTETTGVERSDVYTFNLTANYTATNEYTKVEANVSTSSADAGVYDFLTGGLVINSFKVYTDASHFFTVENQDGTFVVTAAPSGMQTTDLNLDNILLYVDGEFEIVALATMNTYEFNTMVISANEDGNGVNATNITATDEGYSINITSVWVEVGGSGEKIDIVDGKDTYYSSNGTFVFQIADNKTIGATLYATEYVKSITASASSVNPVANTYLLTTGIWQEGDDYAGMLKGATDFASDPSASFETTAPITGASISFAVVYSQAAYITISSVTDQSKDAGLINRERFVNFADTSFQVSNVASNSYSLTKWTSAQGATVAEDGAVTLPAKPKVALVANYSLAKPTGSVAAISEPADPEGKLSFNDLISKVNISNSDPSITYSYSWYKKVGDEYQPAEKLITTTAGTGDYAVEITANKDGYNAVKSDKIPFKITFNKLNWEITNADKQLEYNNQDFALTEQISYTIGGVRGSVTINQALSNNARPEESRDLIISIQKDGESVSTIKDAGTYTIKLSLFDYSGNDYNPQNIYNLTGKTTFTITVTQKNITLTKENSAFTKAYGEKDPTLQKTIQGVNETFIVIYERAGAGTIAGEKVGPHALTSATSQNANYEVTLPPNTDWFEITSRSGMTLTATLSGSVTHVFDNKTPTSVSVEFNAQSKTYTLTINGDSAWTGTLTLSNFQEKSSDGLSRSIDAYDGMLDGLTFSVDGSENVDTYAIKVEGTTAYSNATFDIGSDKVVSITPKTLTINATNGNLSKVYGDEANKTNTYKQTIRDSQTGEDVEVTFTRKPGVDVGDYLVTEVVSNDSNYTAQLSGNVYFKITPVLDLALSVTITGNISQIYNAVALDAKVTQTFDPKSNAWTLTITRGGTTFGTFTLSNFVENGTGISNKTITPTANTLTGFAFSISNPSKNAGSYTITVSGTNSNYAGGITLVGGSDRVVIEKATISLNVAQASFEKTYGEVGPTLERTVQGAGEEVVVLFTRAPGEDVGTYAIETATVKDKANANNYNALTVPQGAKFTINPYEGLKISGHADKTSVHLTYNNALPTIEKTFVSGEGFKLVISNGTQSVEIMISDFKELFDNKYPDKDFDDASKDATLVESLLDGITFKFETSGRGVGTYKIVAEGTNDNYPGGFVFDNQKDITLIIDKATLTIDASSYDQPLFTKVYGSADPNLRAQFDGIGEKVWVTFTREAEGTVEGEKVGKYDLLTPNSENTNYTVVIDPATDNNLFEITRLEGLVLRGRLVGGPVSKDYNGIALNENVEVTWNEGTKDFTLKVTYVGGAEFATFTLNTFEELVAGDAEQTAEFIVDENLLDGFVFKVANAAKDAKTYEIVAIDESNITYSGFVFANSAEVLTITPKEVELDSNNFSLSKTYGQTDEEVYPNNEVSGIATGVGSETISVEYTRVLGENVGSYKITNAQVVDNNNYTVSITDKDNAWFTIKQVAGLKLTAQITGNVTKEFNNKAPQARVEYRGGQWVIVISDDTNEWETLTIGNIQETAEGFTNNTSSFEVTSTLLSGVTVNITAASKDVGTYSIEVVGTSLVNNNYPGGIEFTSGTANVIQITKATFTVSQDDADFSSMYGSDESKTNTFTREVTGVNNYKFNITFTRETGSDVGEYQISSATTQDVNYNTEVVVSTPNEWYSITQVDGLTLSATASVSEVELTYNNSVPTISKKFVDSGADSYWQLVISNGSTQVTVDLTDFQENFASPVSITDAEVLRTIFDDIEFSLQNISKNVGDYTIIATSTDANYPGGFTFGTVTLSINPAALTIKSDSPILSKRYGTSDANPLTKTFESALGELVEVHFGREEGESVGYYDLKDPQSQDGNYKAIIDPAKDNNLFQITALAGLTLTAEISGDNITQAYDGEKDVTVEPKFEDGAWKLYVNAADKVEPLGVYTLSSFKEVVGESITQIQPEDVDATTLSGFTFKIDRTVKDVGTYSIVMDSNNNPNYQGGFEFANSLSVIEITKKMLTVSDITKQFDQNNSFDTSNSNGTNKANINGLVDEETVVLTGRFDSIGVGLAITINNLDISGQYASNYYLESKTSTGSITKNTFDKIVVNLQETEYQYGTITKGLSQLQLSIMLNDQSVERYVSAAASIANVTYSTGEYLVQGKHHVVFTVTSDYYTVENYEVDITVSKIDLIVTADGEITKVYDTNNNVAQTLSLDKVLRGDDVTVSGTYNDAMPGIDKKVTFVLNGADKDNYTLTNPTTTGTIERAIIKITAEIDTLDEGFVDGASAIGKTNFEIAIPLAGSEEEAFATLTAPSKTGYDFEGWTYGEGRDALTATNIDSVLGGALESKALAIYADWRIQTFTVTVVIDDVQGSYTIDPYTDGVKKVHTYNYWDTITVTAVPNTGYIARQEKQTITNIAKNETVNVLFSAANIEFTVSVDRNSLYPTGEAIVEFVSEDWVAQDESSAKRSIAFDKLGEMLAKDFLPQINVYGYTLASWNSGETVVAVDGAETLKEIILKLNASFNENIQLSFNANFDANKHQITFATDGGVPQPEAMEVTFGQAVGKLPEVTKVGYGFAGWVDGEGETYTQDTIFAVDDDVELTATWEVGVFSFDVSVDHAIVEIRDSQNELITPDGTTYRLRFTETYTITVTPNAGYQITDAWKTEQSENFELIYTQEFTQATLSNLKVDSSVTIDCQAVENTITLMIDRANVKVTVDSQPVDTYSIQNGVRFKAKTDTTVVITITPDAGYSVTYKAITTGNGNVQSEGNVYTLTGFTKDSTLVFETSANSYNATFSFETGASGFNIISGGEAVGGNAIKVSTGTDLVILPQFEYGYELKDEGILVSGATYSIDDETGHITFSGFTQAFEVTIQGTEKAFSLKATVFAIDSDHNVQDAEGFAANVKESELFGHEVTFTASKPVDASGYRFVGWFEGTLSAEEGVLNYQTEDIISTDEVYTWVVAGERELTAVYEYAIFTVRANVEGKGQIVYNENVVADSEDGSYFSEQCYYEEEISLTAEAKAGYQFAGWMNGEESYSEDPTIVIKVSQDLSLTAKFVAGDLTFELTSGVLINGILVDGDSMQSLNYGSVEWGSYVDGEFVKAENGDSSTVSTKTDASVYVKVTVNNGYTFDNIYPKAGMLDGEINAVSSTSDEESGTTVQIYEITGLNSANQGKYAFVAKFVAKSTRFNIIFKEGDKQVDAGHITVENSAGVRASGNLSSNVVVDAVTGTTFKVVANIKLGISFVDNDNLISIVNSAATASDINISAIEATSGFSSQATFTISGYTGDASDVVDIVINIQSATYTVELVNFGDSGEASYIIENVKIGDALSLGDRPLPQKQGYKFTGYYVDVTGSGVKYIGADGKTATDKNGNMITWNENGYYWNGFEYVKYSNFTPDENGGGTFKLYANFVLNKTTITFDAVPFAIRDVEPTVGARVVITTFSDANSWMDERDPFTVNVLYGANIEMSAPVYDDYQFAYWEIYKTDEDGETTTEKISDAVTKLKHYGLATVKVVANYYAKVAVTGNEGGVVYYTYEVLNDEQVEEIRVDGEAYIPTDSSVTLHAELEKGYKFLGWFDQNGYKVSDDLVWRIEASKENPILASSYAAVFEGEAVVIHIGEYDSTHGRIVKIESNGSAVDYSSGSFQAKVGDKIEIYMEKDEYYEIVWSGSADLQYNNLYYSYKVNIDDFTDFEMTLTPEFVWKECDVTIRINLADSLNLSEVGLAGVVSYVDEQGVKQVITNQVTFVGHVGAALEIEMTANVNYKLNSVKFNGQDVTDQIDSNKLILTLVNGDRDNFSVVITFARDMWIDSVNDEHALQGDGSRGDPYLIASAEDLAFVSYMINERNNSAFANANYKLMADIDLTGKYWSPIGTQDNPFNGTFNYDVHDISGVTVVFGYNGELSNDRVFGYLGDNANFPEANNDLMIALIIVGVIIFLILLALLIFFLVRRKRKKDLEELANS